MSAHLDTAILFGEEVTYGTPVTLTHAYEGKADTWKREHEVLESTGFRAGMEAKRSDRRKLINMGGAGSLEIDVPRTGSGFLLQALLGSASGPTVNSATSYTSTHTSTPGGPAVSYTIQVQRVAIDGTMFGHTYHGCVITKWSLAVDTSGFLVANIDFDFEDSDNVTADGTPTYIASTAPFDWSEAVVSVNGSPTDVKNFNFSADLGMKTDRRFLRGSELKKQPVRGAMPTFDGSFEVEYEDETLYNLWVAGTIMEISVTFTGAEIESGYDEELSLTLAACQLTGETPEASLGDLAKQTVPFEALDNGSDAVAIISYTDTSSAF